MAVCPGGLDPSGVGVWGWCLGGVWGVPWGFGGGGVLGGVVLASRGWETVVVRVSGMWGGVFEGVSVLGAVGVLGVGLEGQGG